MVHPEAANVKAARGGRLTPEEPHLFAGLRSRLPSALRASWTLDAPEVLFGGKVVPSHGVVPRDVTPVVVLDDLDRLFDDLAAKEDVGVIEAHPYQRTRVEQPVVVVGHLGGLRLVAGEVANVLTSRIVVIAVLVR